MRTAYHFEDHARKISIWEVGMIFVLIVEISSSMEVTVSFQHNPFIVEPHMQGSRN